MAHLPPSPNAVRPPKSASNAIPQPAGPIAGALEEEIWRIAIQTFATLIELCQGPCPENQVARGA